VQRLRPGQILRQPVGELVDRKCRVDAELFDGTCDSKAPSVPDLPSTIQSAEKQHAVMLRMLGSQNENGVRFVETGEVEEVRVLAKREVRVRVARQNARRRNHCGTALKASSALARRSR